MELATQFTEDAYAKYDRTCERSACAVLIRKGEPCFYIAHIDPQKRGKFVCAKCCSHYKRSLATTARPTATRTAISAQVPDTQNPKFQGTAVSTQASGSQPSTDAWPLPDAQAIRFSVNASQRGSAIHPPPVMAFPNPARGIPVPGTHQHLQRHTQGPDVALPSANNTHPSLAMGYSRNHASYHSERERWARFSQTAILAETISLQISALHEGRARRGGRTGHGIPFGNICEGIKDVDALIDAPGLIKIAIDTIVPKIIAFCPSFQWQVRDLVVRDSSWVDLSSYSRSRPYFYNECLHPNRKNPKVPIFKTKQFSLSVVVPESQWLDYEQHAESLECGDSDSDLGNKAERRPPSIPFTDNKSGAFTPEAVASLTSRMRTRTPTQLSHSGFSDVASFSSPLPAIAEPSPSACAPKPGPEPSNSSRMKRTHTQSRSISSTGADSPPRKSSVCAPTLVPFSSPNREELKEALQFGGQASLDVQKLMAQKHENIVFHPIPTRSVEIILRDRQKHCLELNTGGYHGRLEADMSLESLIGIGGFKTAHPGSLMLSPVATFGLGTVPRQDVVVKRMFFKPSDNGPSHGSRKLKISRYSFGHELPKLYREANVLYWAKSLLTMSYEYIDHCIQRSPSSPPFDIPRLRFVHAGLALVHALRSHNSAPSAGTAVGAYLLEERIPCTKEEFTKFIHNMDFTPSIEPEEEGFDIAEFLVFTQHIQYIKTGGLAYISDYQGAAPLLTDPQVLTHPSLNEGKDMFGDGNVEASLTLFEKHHQCNRYCKWPPFNLSLFSLDDDGIIEAHANES